MKYFVIFGLALLLAVASLAWDFHWQHKHERPHEQEKEDDDGSV